MIATGGILSLDRGLPQDRVSRLDIATSWFYFSALRNTFTISDLLPDTAFAADMIYLPGFVAYDDTGASNMVFPFSFALKGQWTFLRTGRWLAGAGVYAGLELIPEYTYMFNPVGGARAYGQWNALDFLFVGVSAGLSDIRAFFAEAALLYRLSALDLMAAFSLDGDYKTLKAGLEYRVTPGFSFLAGGNYTLEYGGWNATGGLDFSGFSVFGIPTRISLGLQYNLIAALSGTLCWTMEFGRMNPASAESRDQK